MFYNKIFKTIFKRHAKSVLIDESFWFFDGANIICEVFRDNLEKLLFDVSTLFTMNFF